MSDREDVDEPVDRDEHRAAAEHEQRAAIAQGGNDGPHLAADGRDHREDDEGPDHAMAEDLDDGDRPHRLEVDREDTPGSIGGEPVEKSATVLAGSVVHAASYGGASKPTGRRARLRDKSSRLR
jgi:hypothetical protein